MIPFQGYRVSLMIRRWPNSKLTYAFDFRGNFREREQVNPSQHTDDALMLWTRAQRKLFFPPSSSLLPDPDRSPLAAAHSTVLPQCEHSVRWTCVCAVRAEKTSVLDEYYSCFFRWNLSVSPAHRLLSFPNGYIERRDSNGAIRFEKRLVGRLQRLLISPG